MQRQVVAKNYRSQADLSRQMLLTPKIVINPASNPKFLFNILIKYSFLKML